jgi:hypothetical protein
MMLKDKHYKFIKINLMSLQVIKIISANRAILIELRIFSIDNARNNSK